MLQPALSRSFAEARKKLCYLMIAYGLSGLDIVKQIHREIFSTEIKLPEELKVMVANIYVKYGSGWLKEQVMKYS